MTSQTELTSLSAARNGDSTQFAALAEPYRRELRAYCYRLLGSLEDADDLVQETMLKAWRRLETFEGRASFRTWLYKIATNACLDALDKASRRRLPIDLCPAANPTDPFAPAVSDPVWLDPFPDDWLDESTPSAEARYTQQESVTLAFLTALQTLPPHQRTVLVLRDVLDWQASEVATLLDMTVSAVNSALHRARVTLSKQQVAARSSAALTPNDTKTRALLDRYVRAWEAVDITGLVALLKEDATFSMPPFPAWFQMRDAIAAFFQAQIFRDDLDWRLQPIHANGQAALAAYQFDASRGCFQAHAIHVLTLVDGQITAINAFLKPELFRYFNLPESLKAEAHDLT